MSDDRNALDSIASEILDWGPGEWIDRMAPLSVGALAGGAVVVAGGALLRTVFRGSRALRVAGAMAAIPLGVWIINNTIESVSGNDAEESDLIDAS